MSILYHSTNNTAEQVSFRQALLNGMASNYGLYMMDRDDIPVLSYFFLNKFATQYGKSIQGLSTEVLAAMLRHGWPGNVRELEHLVQRMVILCEGDKVEADLLPPSLSESPDSQETDTFTIPPQSLEELETWFIRKILRETQGDRGLAAQILGIDKSTLWRKIKRNGLEA